MKKRLLILNLRYFDHDGCDITIGGVQTYISNLAKVAFELGMSVEVFQYANHDFTVEYQGIEVHGVKTNFRSSRASQARRLYKTCMKSFDLSKDILLYGTELLAMKAKNPFALAIQHGIGWDLRNDAPCGRIKNSIHIIRQAIRALSRAQNAASVKKMICVDYNYINWYRTQILVPEMDYQVIPNFTQIPAPNFEKQKSETIKIIFARRFVPHRGTRIFAEAIDKLLTNYDNIEITFAGDGPDEQMLKERFASRDNVKFITYLSGESLNIHKDKQIAVVPTVCSEGTSLSLLEAMASGCAVICSNVGGLSNIVIDNYNGLMVNPNSNDLYCALERMIKDQTLRTVLAERAYDSAKHGFSYDNWKEKWKQVLIDF